MTTITVTCFNISVDTSDLIVILLGVYATICTSSNSYLPQIIRLI